MLKRKHTPKTFKGQVVRCNCNSDWQKDVREYGFEPIVMLDTDMGCPDCGYFPWVPPKKEEDNGNKSTS